MMFSVYLVRCADRTLYTGIARNVQERVTAHNTSPRGAKYTRARRPVRLVYQQAYRTRGAALRAEARIKKLSRVEKLRLVRAARAK